MCSPSIKGFGDCPPPRRRNCGGPYTVTYQFIQISSWDPDPNPAFNPTYRVKFSPPATMQLDEGITTFHTQLVTMTHNYTAAANTNGAPLGRFTVEAFSEGTTSDLGGYGTVAHGIVTMNIHER